MKVSRFVFNMFGVNTYVVYDPATLEAAVIDPGMIDHAETKALEDFMARNNLRVTHLINTHMHLDHIFGNLKVKERYGVEIEAHPDDDFLGRSLGESAARFHIPVSTPDHGVDIALHDGDVIMIGKEPLEVLYVPGHSPGSIALYAPESGFVITGDALFAGSVGRTDLPGGDHATLISAIRNKLMTLPDNTVVIPGHGGETTIGHEKMSNPFI